MKKIYKILFFISLIIFIEDTFAQKNLKLVIDNVQVITSAYGNGGNPDRSCVGWCTGWGNSSKKPDIRWRILDGSGGTINNVNDGCWSVCDDCSTATRDTGSNTVVIDNNYNCASNWPSGNANFTIVTEEWDCVSVCSAGSTEELAKLSLSIPIPTSTNGNPIAATGSPFTATATKNVTCGNMTLALTVTMHWEVSSSFLFNSTNDDVCAAHDFGTLNAGANTGFITYNNTCSTTQPSEPRTGNMSNTMWYKFRTPSTGLLSATITAEEAGAGANYTAVAVYQKSGACSGVTGLTEVGFDRWCASNGGDVTVDCLLADTDYYIQLGTGYNFGACTDLVMGGRSTGDYRVRVTTNSNTAAPDNICNGASINATFLGNINSTSGSFTTLNNQSNECAGTESGEPSGGQKTVWYYFTTGATVGRNITVTMTEQDGIDPDLYLYSTCGNVCGGPTWTNLQDERNSFDADATNLFDTDAQIDENGYLKPNSTYFIRCDGNGILETEGVFSLAVNWSGTFNGNDDICNAWTVGASNSPGGSGAAHTESATNNNILDLGETITVPTFNNKQASTQEQCALDEPNNDEDDETVWFAVTTSPNPGSEIDIDVSASNGTGGVDCLLGAYAWIKVYEADGTPALPVSCAGWNNTTNWFDGLIETSGSYYGAALTIGGVTIGDNSKFRINCPKPNHTYYLQIETLGLGCDMADFTMTVKDNGFKAAPDYICLPASETIPGMGSAVDSGFLGILNSSYDLRTRSGSATALEFPGDYDLAALNQTTKCATVSSGEPDYTGSLSDPNNTAWYRFRTPPADYPSTNSLMHTYTIDIEKRSGSGSLTVPAMYLYKETATTARACGDNSTDYNNLSLVDSKVFDFSDWGAILESAADGFDVKIQNICLEPNTNYYIQVENTGIGDYINFDLYIRKEAFRPGDLLCEATDLGYITQNGLQNGIATSVAWNNNVTPKFSAAPFFGLPHTNRCTGSEAGEPNLENSKSFGPPSPTGNHQATVWYTFETGNQAPDWILWAKDDDASLFAGSSYRGTACSNFGAKVLIYTMPSSTNCNVPGNLVLEDEVLLTTDPTCNPETGIGFGLPNAAPCNNGMFRIKCPTPNTKYFVQIQDAGRFSTCYEGEWAYPNDANEHVTTAPGLSTPPINDSICNAIDLGGNYDATSKFLTYNINIGNGNNIFDNFCATPDNQWRADFSQPLEADVWFRFKPPVSGSVLITAQSAPNGKPSSIDDDIDIQLALWEPILGDGTNLHCSDPRYLWTPLLAQDHKDCEQLEATLNACTGFTSDLTFAYDIYNTCGSTTSFGGGIFCNEGNSFIATCLDPNKYYYLQVDGGHYSWAGGLLWCDIADAGDCSMGYFDLQIKDAGLGLVNPANTAANISPYTALGVRNYQYVHDEPCFANPLEVQPSTRAYNSLEWEKMTNRCATSITDPLPATWANRNSSTDKTVWAYFVAPPSGKVKIRTENIPQIKGEDDYHQDINLQLALFYTPNCFDKWRLEEINTGFGFDGICIEADPTNDNDFTEGGVCPTDWRTFSPTKWTTCGFNEYMVVSCLTPGLTYYIMIDGDASYVAGSDFEDVEGDFRISVQAVGNIPPSKNDMICNSDTIIGVNTLLVGSSITTGIYNNSCATTEPNIEGSGKIAEINNGAYQDTILDIIQDEFTVEHSLWFKFQAPASGKVKIEAINDGNDIDLGVAVFDITNQDCGDLATNGYKIMDDYDPISQDEDLEVYCLIPDRWYWVQVDGDRNTLCGPLLADICNDPLRDTTGQRGSDCETGEFRLKITHLAADPTYISNVDYTPNPDLPGGNDNYCEAHRVRGASGNINIFNNTTYLHNGETIAFRHNNRCATTEVNEPGLNGWNLNPFNAGNTPTVWYAFNTGPILPPLLPGEITINVTNPSGICFDPDMDLYEYTGPLNSYYTAAGCTNLGANKFNRLYRVGEGSNIPYLPALRPERITLTCPKPMTTYLIRIAGSSNCPLFGDNMGDFDLSISMATLPGLDVVNDDICNAKNMGTLTAGGNIIRNGENNFCATQQQGEPNTSQNCVQSEPCADETVWFKFKTSATPGDIEVVVKDVLALGFIAAPQIAIYRYVGNDNSCSVTPFSNLAQLDINTGVVINLGVQVDSAKVTIPCARPNTWYYVQVDGIDMALLGFPLPGSTDNFMFNLQARDLGNYSARAGNDNLANAYPMDSTINAPNPYILPAGGTKSRKGHNICATCENSEDGDYCGTDETGHTASFSAEDETVWFYFTTSDNPGTTTITVADNPSIAGTFSPNFTLYYYNQSLGSPQFRVTNAPSRKLIQEGSSSSGIGSSTSVSYTCLLPNTRYLIQVDGNDNVPSTTDQGDFIITVSDDGSGNPGPSNDLICNAETLSTTMASAASKTNRCAWEETGEPNTSSNMGGTGDDVTSNDYDETVWFTFVPSAEQSVRLQLDVTSGLLGGINYVLYETASTSTITCTGTPANIPTWSQLNEIASGSSTLLVGNEIDETWPCLKNNKRYYLQIDGNDMIGADDVGNFNIQLTNSNQTTPLNDDICGIGSVPGIFPSVSTSGNFGAIGNVSITKTFNNQNNTCATQEVAEPETNGPLNDITNPSYDHTLWYKFVASSTDGTYNISITNDIGATDIINGYIGLFRQNVDTISVCPGTIWNRMSKVKESNNFDLVNNETLSLECWEIEEGMTYYFQVQGIDGLLGGDVGNDFNVSVQFIAGTTNPADNICTAPTVNIGTTYSADNRCATTQPNEPNLDPNPQTPLDGKSYDETLWYKFVAPASGEVKLTLSNFSIPMLLSVNMQLYEAPTGYNCSVNHFNGLIPNESASLITSISPSIDFRCLAPGKTYYIQFDGNDAFTDRGTWDFVITDLYSANVPPANDEPCGAIDVTQHIRSAALGPCSDDGYYTETYSIADLAEDIDQATKTATAIGCNGELNCNDYWFKFTVPLDASGIRIQGNDEYSGIPGINNSDEHIGIYRAPSGCGGALQQINCGSGGFNNNVDMTIAAYPGEILYLQVFDASAPANPSRTTFGFCLSVDCPAKLPCHPTVDLGYDQPQCWNMNTNGTDYSPIYYDCLSGDNNSVNYFTFRTDCDGTPNDTVQVIFSLTEMGCGKTAMSIVSDNTPCTPDFQDILLNCAVFQEVLGGTTATNFNQTYILPGCTNYIVQIIGDNNTASCASSGQILFVRGNTPTTVLPIELLSFTGYNDGDVNVLNWVTASERNSAKFEIEKSYDASTFEYIGEVPAAGNSIIELGYNFNDPNPQFGDNYYRLKMIDSDGTFKYSEIINIKVREDNMAVQDGIIKIYPNPTNGYLNIQYQSSRDNNIDLQIFDMLGKNMLSKTEHVTRGMNIIQVNAFSFAKAMYVLKLIDQFNGNEHQAKFIKE